MNLEAALTGAAGTAGAAGAAGAETFANGLVNFLATIEATTALKRVFSEWGFAINYLQY
jgi:hypothetical protein